MVLFQKKNISIRVWNPDESRKASTVKLKSNDSDIDGVYLENIGGTNLWQGIIRIPTNKQHVEIGVSFKFNSSWRLGTVKFHEQNKESKFKTRLFPVESLLIIQSDENREAEYCSHCLYILRSAKDSEELECMTQTKMLEKMSQGLSRKQKERILKKIIEIVEKGLEIRRANSAAFLCFLSQMDISTSELKNMMPINLAKQVFQQCLSTICTPNSIQGMFATMENVYKSAFREEANFMSYCSYMYDFFGPKTSCYMLSKWKSENGLTTLLPSNPEYSRQTLKSLVEKVFHSFEEDYEISKEINFLKELQVSLTLELQIELIKDLESRKISPFDVHLGIFNSSYEKKMNEFSRKGEVNQIVCEWNRIASCPLLYADKLREKTKKYLISSFDKTTDLQLQNACSLLTQLCVNGTLFTDAVSKHQMMQQMATSLNENFHSLLPVCLNKWTLEDIPNEDVETIVISWFSHALKHHCNQKFTRNKVSTSLLKLYLYVDKISSHPLLQSESDLKRKLDRKTIDYLKKELEIVDIVNSVPEMAKLENGPTENMFRDHIRELFTQGLQNKDLEKQTLFQHIRIKEVDSQ